MGIYDGDSLLRVLNRFVVNQKATITDSLVTTILVDSNQVAQHNYDLGKMAILQLLEAEVAHFKQTNDIDDL